MWRKENPRALLIRIQIGAELSRERVQASWALGMGWAWLGRRERDKVARRSRARWRRLWISLYLPIQKQCACAPEPWGDMEDRKADLSDPWYPFFLFPPSSDPPWPFLVLIYFVLPSFYALWHGAMFSLLVVQVGPLLVSFDKGLTKPESMGWWNQQLTCIRGLAPATQNSWHSPGAKGMPGSFSDMSLSCLPVDSRNLCMWFLSCHSRKRNTVGNLLLPVNEKPGSQSEQSQGTGSHSVLCPYLKGMASKSWVYSNFQIQQRKVSSHMVFRMIFFLFTPCWFVCLFFLLIRHGLKFVTFSKY